jgi:hypothetical protein
MVLEHNEEFERERLFHAALGEAMRQCPHISAGTVETIIGLVAPEFLEGLFERRPCARKLRYLGRWWTGDWDGLPPALEVGRVYESVDFNGATYTVRVDGQRTRQMGRAYFERLT